MPCYQCPPLPPTFIASRSAGNARAAVQLQPTKSRLPLIRTDTLAATQLTSNPGSLSRGIGNCNPTRTAMWQLYAELHFNHTALIHCTCRLRQALDDCVARMLAAAAKLALRRRSLLLRCNGHERYPRTRSGPLRSRTDACVAGHSRNHEHHAELVQNGRCAARSELYRAWRYGRTLTGTCYLFGKEHACAVLRAGSHRGGCDRFFVRWHLS
jgi:hypothetical protein